MISEGGSIVGQRSGVPGLWQGSSRVSAGARRPDGALRCSRKAPSRSPLLAVGNLCLADILRHSQPYEQPSLRRLPI